MGIMSTKQFALKKVSAVCIVLSVFVFFDPGYAFVFFDPGDSEMIGTMTRARKKHGKISIGLEYENVSNRKMAFDGGTLVKRVSGVNESFLFTRPGESINDVAIKSSRLMVKRTVEIISWLDFFVEIGTSDITLEYKRTRPGFIGQTIEFIKFSGRSNVSVGAGFKGKIRPGPWPGWIIIGDAQILKSRNDGNYAWTGVDFPTDFSPGNDSATAKIHEWQVAISFAKVLSTSMIYAGAKYSYLEVDLHSDIESPATDPPFTASRQEQYVADSNIGLFLGAEADIIRDKLSIGIELRYINETASRFGLNWRF